MKQILIALAAAATIVAGPVEARTAKLNLVAPAGATQLPVGESKVGARSHFYRPASAHRGAPLLVVLPAAGGIWVETLKSFKPYADRCGCQLLVINPRDRTWDLSLGISRIHRRGAVNRGSVESAIGPDAEEMEKALGQVLVGASVDRSRVGLIGMYAGANYSLTAGLANPGLFRSVVAVGPAYFLPPLEIDPSQRVLVAQNRHMGDFAFTRDRIVPMLKETGVQVTFTPMVKNLESDDEEVSTAIGFVLGRPIG